MTVRRGLTQGDVIDAAMRIVDAESTAALSLSRVARELKVKPPSLYNHVTGVDSLRRDIGLRVMHTLADRLGKVVMGRAGRDALLAVAADFRAYVTAHPHLYELSTQMRPDDEEYSRAGLLAIEPVVAVLRSYNFEPDEGIHAARALRSALHGFVSLELVGGFGLDVDVDESFEWLVGRLIDTFEPPSPPNN